ncbi:MAG TPA: hypothetical protein H9907_04325 [Candidatus Corynebacterium intestinavium]|uniref:Uncharacterized protein n=1 Tax=Candidatus Corynebacterium intestinavium TaxID=2838531 RepID=A0A9D2UBI3_9CORY|nr:hypothetical protein [Candidatus Corynebacterium intestinavium]
MKKPPLAFEALAAAAGTAAFYGIKDFLPASRRRGWLRGAALVAGIGPYVVRSTADTMEFAKEEFAQESRQTAELRKILDGARARQAGSVSLDGDVADLAAGKDVAVDGDAFNDDVVPDGAVGNGAVDDGAVDEDGEDAEEIWPPNDPRWWDRVFSLPPYAVLPGAAVVLVLAVTAGVRIDRAIQRAAVKALESRGVEYPNAAWGGISGVIAAAAVVADRETAERAGSAGGRRAR